MSTRRVFRGPWSRRVWRYRKDVAVGFAVGTATGAALAYVGIRSTRDSQYTIDEELTTRESTVNTKVVPSGTIGLLAVDDDATLRTCGGAAPSVHFRRIGEDVVMELDARTRNPAWVAERLTLEGVITHSKPYRFHV